MIKVNLAIRAKSDSETMSYNLLISDSPNDYGIITCKITDETLTEIFTSSKENYDELLIDIQTFISKLGKVINVHIIDTPNEIKELIKKLLE